MNEGELKRGEGSPKERDQRPVMEKIIVDGCARSESTGAHESRVSFASNANDPRLASGSSSPPEQYLRAHRSTHEPSAQPSLLRSLGSSAVLDGNSKATVNSVLDRIAAASSTLEAGDGRNSTNNSTASFPTSVVPKSIPSPGYQSTPGGGYNYGSAAQGSQHRSEELEAITRINVELVDAMGELQNTIILMEAEHKRQVALLQEEMMHLHDEITKMHRENSRLKERVANDVLRERQTRRFEVAYEKANIATRVRRAGLRHLESTEERMMEMHDDMYFIRRCDSMRSPVLNVSFVLHFIDGIREYPFVGETSLAISVARELFMEAARRYAGYHVCTVRAVDVYAFHSAVAALNFSRQCHILLLEAPWSKRVTANSAFSVIRAIGTASAAEQAADRGLSPADTSALQSPTMKRLQNVPSLTLEPTKEHDLPLSKKKKQNITTNKSSNNNTAKYLKDGAQEGDATETSELLFAGPRIRTCLFGCSPGVEVNGMTGMTLYYGQCVQQMCEALVKDVRVGEIAVNKMWCTYFSVEHNILLDKNPRDDFDTKVDGMDAGQDMIEILSAHGGVTEAFMGFVEPNSRATATTAEKKKGDGSNRWDIQAFSDASHATAAPSSSSRLAYSLIPWHLRLRRQCTVFSHGNSKNNNNNINPGSLATTTQEPNPSSSSGGGGSMKPWRIVDELAEKQAKKVNDGKVRLAAPSNEPVVQAEPWAPFASEGMAISDILLGIKGLTFVVPSARKANIHSAPESPKEKHPMWLAARQPMSNSDASSGGKLLTLHTLKEKLMSVRKRNTVVQRYCESLEAKAMQQQDRYEMWRATSHILPNEIVYICTVDLLTEDVWSSQLQRFLIQYDERYQQDMGSMAGVAGGGGGGGAVDRRAGESNAANALAPPAGSTAGKTPGNPSAAPNNKTANSKPKKKEAPNDDMRLLSEAAAKKVAAFVPRWSHELLMALREALAAVVQSLGTTYSGVYINGNGLDLLTYAFRTPEQAMAFVAHVYDGVLLKTKEVLGIGNSDPLSATVGFGRGPAGDQASPLSPGVPKAKTGNPPGTPAASSQPTANVETPTSPSPTSGGKNTNSTLTARGDEQREKKLTTESTFVKNEDGTVHPGVIDEDMLVLVRAGVSRGKVGDVRRRFTDADTCLRIEDSNLVDPPVHANQTPSLGNNGDGALTRQTTSAELLSQSYPLRSQSVSHEIQASISSFARRSPLSSQLYLPSQQHMSHGNLMAPEASSRTFKNGNGISNSSSSYYYYNNATSAANFPAESQSSRSLFRPECETDVGIVGNVGPGVRLSAKLCDRATPGEILVSGDVMAQFYANRENLTSRMLHVVRVRDDGYNPESLRSLARAAISRVSANTSDSAAAQAAFATTEWDFVLSTKPNPPNSNATQAKRMGIASLQEEVSNDHKGPSHRPPPLPQAILNAQNHGFSQKNVFSVLPRQYTYRRKLVRSTLNSEWAAGLTSKWTPANSPDVDASRNVPTAPQQARNNAGPPAGRKMTKAPGKSERKPSLPSLAPGPLVNPTPDSFPMSNLFAASIRRVYPILTRGTTPSFAPNQVRALMTQLRARMEAMEESCMARHDTYVHACAQLDETQEDPLGALNALALLTGESTSESHPLPLRNGRPTKTASTSSDLQDGTRGGFHSFAGGTLPSMSSSTRATLPMVPPPPVQLSRAGHGALALLNERSLMHIAANRQPCFDPVKLVFKIPPLRGFLYCSLVGTSELMTEMVAQQKRNPERFFGAGIAGDLLDAVMIGMAAERVAQLQEHFHYIVFSSVHDARGTPFRYRPPEEFVAYFPTPHDALDAAAQIQDRLLHTNWPENVTMLESALRVKSPSTGQLLFNGVRAAISVHCASCLDGGDQWLDSHGNHFARESATKAAKRDAKDTAGRKIAHDEKVVSESVANMIVTKQTVDPQIIAAESGRQPPLCVSVHFTGGAVEKTVALGHTANGGDILVSGAMMHYLVAPQRQTRLCDAVDDETDYTRRNHVRDTFAFFSTHGYNSSGMKEARRRSTRRLTAAAHRKSMSPGQAGASFSGQRSPSKVAETAGSASRSRGRRTLAVSGLEDVSTPVSMDLYAGARRFSQSKPSMLNLDDADGDNDAVVSEAEKLLHRDESAANGSGKADGSSSAPPATSPSQRGKRDPAAQKAAATAPKAKGKSTARSTSPSQPQQAKLDAAHSNAAAALDAGNTRTEDLFDATYLCIPRSLMERMKLQLSDGHAFHTISNAHEKSTTSTMAGSLTRKHHTSASATHRRNGQQSDQDWKPIIVTVRIENDVASITTNCAIEPQNSPWAFPGCTRGHYEWFENVPLLRGAALERKKLFVGGASLRLALRGIHRPALSKDMQRLGAAAAASHHPSISKMANRRMSAIEAVSLEGAVEHATVSALHAFNARVLSQMSRTLDSGAGNHSPSLTAREHLLQASLSVPCVFSITPKATSQTLLDGRPSSVFNGSAVEYLCGLLDAAACVLTRGVERSALRRYQLQVFLHNHPVDSSGSTSKEAHLMSDYAVAELPPPSLSAAEKSHHSLACILVAVGGALHALGNEKEMMREKQHDDDERVSEEATSVEREESKGRSSVDTPGAVALMNRESRTSSLLHGRIGNDSTIMSVMQKAVNAIASTLSEWDTFKNAEDFSNSQPHSPSASHMSTFPQVKTMSSGGFTGSSTFTRSQNRQVSHGPLPPDRRKKSISRPGVGGSAHSISERSPRASSVKYSKSPIPPPSPSPVSTDLPLIHAPPHSSAPPKLTHDSSPSVPFTASPHPSLTGQQDQSSWGLEEEEDEDGDDPISVKSAGTPASTNNSDA